MKPGYYGTGLRPVPFNKGPLALFPWRALERLPLRVRRGIREGQCCEETGEIENSFGWGSKEGFIEEMAFVLSLEERLNFHRWRLFMGRAFELKKCG